MLVCGVGVVLLHREVVWGGVEGRGWLVGLAGEHTVGVLRDRLRVRVFVGWLVGVTRLWVALVGWLVGVRVAVGCSVVGVLVVVVVGCRAAMVCVPVGHCAGGLFPGGCGGGRGWCGGAGRMLRTSQWT